MKKLSLLVALILCVTIGGVYATWTYAGEKVTDAKYESVIRLTDAVESGAYGTYTVESNLKLFIDQSAVGDYSAKLVFSKNNAEDNRDIFLKVTFKPNTDLATPDIITNGISSQLSFAALAPMQVKAKEATINVKGSSVKKYILDESASPVNILKFADPETIVWTKDGDVFTFTLDQEALESKIKLAYDFYLPTKADYDTFSQGLSSNVVIKVSDIHSAS